MKHDFNQRKQNRIDYAQQQAQKNEQKSQELLNSAHDMASIIPMGQPILVGHHSEKADRNYRGKIDNKYRKSVEASRKADHYREKAKTIESNDAIFSDDPEVLKKLDEKIASLEKVQEFMKSANKHIRKNDREAFLKMEGASVAIWEELTRSGRFGGQGFASFTLTNNNANIRRLKLRRDGLAKMQNRQTKAVEIQGLKLVENVESNRVQLMFDDTPSAEVRQKLKKIHGFRWCRSEGAWQRHLNSSGLFEARRFLKWYEENQV